MNTPKLTRLGQGYTAVSKSEAIKFAQFRLGRGYALSYAAGELGVSLTTLKSWIEKAEPPKSMVPKSTVKYVVGDVVKVIADNATLSAYCCSAKHGKTYEIESVNKNGKDVKLKRCNWVRLQHIEHTTKTYTKEEWLIAIIGGRLGMQSGNPEQRWRYFDGGFQDKIVGNNNWLSADIYRLRGDRVYTLAPKTTKMTVAQIEEKLGIDNLEVVA